MSVENRTDDVVTACPECDGTNIYSRKRKTPTWRCVHCESKFEEPNRRERQGGRLKTDAHEGMVKIAGRPQEGQSLVNLSAFQRDIIVILARDGPSKGLGIKEALGEFGHGEVNHGRLYPNLDALAEGGWIEKSARDRRTNEYELTDEAVHSLARYSIRVENALLNQKMRQGADDER